MQDDLSAYIRAGRSFHLHVFLHPPFRFFCTVIGFVVVYRRASYEEGVLAVFIPGAWRLYTSHGLATRFGSGIVGAPRSLDPFTTRPVMRSSSRLQHHLRCVPSQSVCLCQRNPLPPTHHQHMASTTSYHHRKRTDFVDAMLKLFSNSHPRPRLSHLPHRVH